MSKNLTGCHIKKQEPCLNGFLKGPVLNRKILDNSQMNYLLIERKTLYLLFI
jgi:hypothetical protein